MLDIIKKNKVWFSIYFLALALATVGLFKMQTGELITYFSEHRTPFVDDFFRIATQIGEEPFYIALVIIYLFVRFRYSLMIASIGIIVTIVSFLSKSFFLHDRPKMFFEKLQQFDQIKLVEDVHVVTGQTSFPSGHTMSGFALFGFLAFLLSNKKIGGLLCILMAILIGISRVYLVQHFLKDIYLGSIMGTFISMLLYWWQDSKPIDESKWYDRKIKLKKRA